MPALPKQQIFEEHVDGTSFSAKVDASVTVDGVFSLGIPPELESIAYAIKDKDGAHIGQHNSNCPYRIYGKTLAACKNFLGECALQYLSATETTVRVIVYRTQIDVSAWIGKDKKLYPNGSLEEGDGGTWWEPKTQHGISSTNRVEQYGIGIAARVYDKITTTRKSGEVIRWEEVDRDEEDTAIKFLNGFNSLAIDPEREHSLKEMPYTPEAAQFFTKVMLGLCQLGMNIDAFFGDEKRLLGAIASGQSLLTYTPDERTKTAKS